MLGLLLTHHAVSLEVPLAPLVVFHALGVSHQLAQGVPLRLRQVAHLLSYLSQLKVSIMFWRVDMFSNLVLSWLTNSQEPHLSLFEFE